MIGEEVGDLFALLRSQHHSRPLPFHDHRTVLRRSFIYKFVVCLGTVFVRFIEPLFQVFFRGDDLPEKICKTKKLRMGRYGSVVIYSGRYKIYPRIEKRSNLRLVVDQTDPRASLRQRSKTERLKNSKGTII